MTAVEFLKERLPSLFENDESGFYTRLFEKAKEIEEQQKGYTKEDVIKAGEIGEVNHIDTKHIASLLDEAKQLNKKI